jgi:hypothetical protein
MRFVNFYNHAKESSSAQYLKFFDEILNASSPGIILRQREGSTPLNPDEKTQMPPQIN